MSVLGRNDLRRIFEKLDRDGDGLVSLDELNWLLERIGVDGSQFGPEDLESLVGKSSLSFDEFVKFHDVIISSDESFMEQPQCDGDIDALMKAFEVFDLNGDGVITEEELKNVLGRLGLWDENKDSRSMICAYDANFDGVLDFEEFKNMMLQSSTAPIS